MAVMHVRSMPHMNGHSSSKKPYFTRNVQRVGVIVRIVVEKSEVVRGEKLARRSCDLGTQCVRLGLVNQGPRMRCSTQLVLLMKHLVA